MLISVFPHVNCPSYRLAYRFLRVLTTSLHVHFCDDNATSGMTFDRLCFLKSFSCPLFDSGDFSVFLLDHQVVDVL